MEHWVLEGALLVFIALVGLEAVRNFGKRGKKWILAIVIFVSLGLLAFDISMTVRRRSAVADVVALFESIPAPRTPRSMEELSPDRREQYSRRVASWEFRYSGKLLTVVDIEGKTSPYAPTQKEISQREENATWKGYLAASHAQLTIRLCSEIGLLLGVVVFGLIATMTDRRRARMGPQ